jgi:hypothetical protein
VDADRGVVHEIHVVDGDVSRDVEYLQILDPDYAVTFSAWFWFILTNDRRRLRRACAQQKAYRNYKSR